MSWGHRCPSATYVSVPFPCTITPTICVLSWCRDASALGNTGKWGILVLFWSIPTKRKNTLFVWNCMCVSLRYKPESVKAITMITNSLFGSATEHHIDTSVFNGNCHLTHVLIIIMPNQRISYQHYLPSKIIDIYFVELFLALLPCL